VQANIFLAILLRFSGVFLSFVLNVYFSRVLEKEVIGEYFFLCQILLVLSVVLRKGTDTTFLKFAHKMAEKDIKLVATEYIANTLKPLLVFLSFILLFVYYFAPIDSFYTLAFVVTSLIPFTVFNIIAEYIKGLNYQISATVIQACLLPIFVFVFFVLIKNNIFIAYVLAVVTIMVIALYQVKKSINKQQISGVNANFSAVNFWLDARTFMFIGLLNIAMNSMDLIMLGLLIDTKSVAEYGIANKLVALASIFLVAVNGVLGPKFSTLWQKKQTKEIYNLFVNITLFMLFTALVMVITFTFWGEELLVLIYGDPYSNSAPLLTILALGQSIVLATGPVAYLLMMTNSKKAHQKSLIIAVIINFILNIILIPLYGAIGAATATAIGLIIKNLYSFNYLIFKTEFRKMKHG